MPRTQKKTDEKRIPLNLIDSAITKVSSITHQQPTVPVQNEDHGQNTIRYHTQPRKPTTGTGRMAYMPVLHSSSRMRKAVPSPPIVGERNCNNLRKMLMPSNPPTQKPHEPGQDQETKGCFKVYKKMHHLQRTSRAKHHLQQRQNQKDILHQRPPELLFQQHYIPDWLTGLYSTWGRLEIPCRTDFTTTDQTSKPTKTL